MRSKTLELAPISSITNPRYPTRSARHRSTAPWRRIAVAIGASAALLLPACGGDLGCDPRLAGDTQPVHEVRTAGTPMPVQQDPVQGVEPPKKPEDVQPFVPDPEPRLAGVAMPAQRP